MAVGRTNSVRSGPRKIQLRTCKPSRVELVASNLYLVHMNYHLFKPNQVKMHSGDTLGWLTSSRMGCSSSPASLASLRLQRCPAAQGAPPEQCTWFCSIASACKSSYTGPRCARKALQGFATEMDQFLETWPNLVWLCSTNHCRHWACWNGSTSPVWHPAKTKSSETTKRTSIQMDIDLSNK